MNPITLHILGQTYVFRYIPAPSGFRYRLLSDPSKVGNILPFYMAETVGRDNDQKPKVNLSWFDCIKICADLSHLRIEGKSESELNARCNELAESDELFIRLPTEFEWEWAALGREEFEYAGCTNVNEVAWYHIQYGGNTDKMQKVGLKKPNGYGLYDMSGNAFEWTSSKWDKENNPRRVGRGGSWYFGAADARVAGRFRRDPGLRRGYLGLRLCFSANPTVLDLIQKSGLMR